MLQTNMMSILVSYTKRLCSSNYSYPNGTSFGPSSPRDMNFPLNIRWWCYWDLFITNQLVVFMHRWSNNFFGRS